MSATNASVAEILSAIFFRDSPTLRELADPLRQLAEPLRLLAMAAEEGADHG